MTLTRKWILLPVALVELALAVYFFFTVRDIVLAGNDSPTPTITTHTPTPAPSATPTATPQPTLTPTPAASPTPLPSPTPTPKPGAVRKLQEKGLVIVYIPAGSFRMGSGEHKQGNDTPRHTVQLDAFWIMRSPVTNISYARCVAEGGCTRPIRQEINPHYYNPDYARHPVVYITWDQAQAFCQWGGGQLPTEAQWERAASGDGKRPFPWGDDDPGPERANTNHPNGETRVVGSYPDGASPFGVLDLGGNVREWVADWYSPTYYKVSSPLNPTGPDSGEKKVLRGAAWHDPLNFSLVTHRLAHVPGSPGANRGFRCAFPAR